MRYLSLNLLIVDRHDFSLTHQRMELIRNDSRTLITLEMLATFLFDKRIICHVKIIPFFWRSKLPVFSIERRFPPWRFATNLWRHSGISLLPISFPSCDVTDDVIIGDWLWWWWWWWWWEVLRTGTFGGVWFVSGTFELWWTDGLICDPPISGESVRSE